MVPSGTHHVTYSTVFCHVWLNKEPSSFLVVTFLIIDSQSTSLSVGKFSDKIIVCIGGDIIERGFGNNVVSLIVQQVFSNRAHLLKVFRGPEDSWPHAYAGYRL